MSAAPSAETGTSGVEAISSGGDSLLGMAMLGKTAAALALVILTILICTAILKRLGSHGHAAGRHLKVVGSTALSSRERLVVVELEGTWLVLGVGGGQITKLHELPAPQRPLADVSAEGQEYDRFARRFARALKQNAGLGGSGRRET